MWYICNRSPPQKSRRLGWRKIQSGQTVTPEQLEANYIRRTDAEMLEKIRQLNLHIREAIPADIPAMMELDRAESSCRALVSTAI